MHEITEIKNPCPHCNGTGVKTHDLPASIEEVLRTLSIKSDPISRMLYLLITKQQKRIQELEVALGVYIPEDK